MNIKTRIAVGFACVLSTGASLAATDVEIAAAVATDTVRPVRQGGVDGQAYWNGKSVAFLYPPSFDFAKVDAAVRYRYVLEDDARNVTRFEAATPNETLARVWAQLPCGMYRLEVLGINKRGKVEGLAGYRKFWKSAAFCPYACPKGVCGYAEASTKYFDWLFEMENTKSYLEKGRPDENYSYNAFPCKTDAAVVNAFVSYAQLRPERKDAALTVARRAADHLLSLMMPADAPLAHFPHTYRILHPESGFGEKDQQANKVAKMYAGMNMIVYPAGVGNALLNLYGAVREEKYLTAAVNIAETYAKLQGEDGTWYLKLWEKDGSPVASNRLFPLAVCNFLEKLYEVTGNGKYRAMSDRAFAYVEKGPLSDWNWEAQFEDVEPSKRYRNLTVHTPVATAIHLLKRYPNDLKRRALARECLRFAEDQFVFWKPPFRADGTGPIFGDTPMINSSTAADFFDVPGAYEQYDWYLPIDSSAAKMISGYLAFYRVEGQAVDLAKARALGDAITVMQEKHGKNGGIPTHWVRWEVGAATQPWINCGIGTANVLKSLSEVADTTPAGTRN